MRIMKNRKTIIITLVLIALAFAKPIATSARQIQEFSNFTIVYVTPGSSAKERNTNALVKAVTNRKAVVNLCNDGGSAWVSCVMRNSNGDARGSVTLQRNTRKTFSNTGTANYYYHLGIRKTYNTGGGRVSISGSWSPDEK